MLVASIPRMISMNEMRIMINFIMMIQKFHTQTQVGGEDLGLDDFED